MTPADRAGLSALAAALQPGAAVSVPREWVLELLGSLTVPESPELLGPDFTVKELGHRLNRKASTCRGWCERGLLPGAYRWAGTREWRIPLSAVLRFEESQRNGGQPFGSQTHRGSRTVADLAAWRAAG